MILYCNFPIPTKFVCPLCCSYTRLLPQVSVSQSAYLSLSHSAQALNGVFGILCSHNGRGAGDFCWSSQQQQQRRNLLLNRRRKKVLGLHAARRNVFFSNGSVSLTTLAGQRATDPAHLDGAAGVAQDWVARHDRCRRQRRRRKRRNSRRRGFPGLQTVWF